MNPISIYSWDVCWTSEFAFGSNPALAHFPWTGQANDAENGVNGENHDEHP